MRRIVQYLAPIGLAAILLVSATGCNYFANRGRDLGEIMDFGLSVNDQPIPHFAVYFDVLSIFSLGGSYFDGKLVGAGDDRFGIVDLEQKSWAVLLYGREKKGSGPFDPSDPYEARKDQRDATERPTFTNGLVGVLARCDPPPPLGFVECDKFVHLGWIGIYNSCHLSELFDFILGWTTLDIMGDDVSCQVSDEAPCEMAAE
jgi:hypothetical protein